MMIRTMSPLFAIAPGALFTSRQHYQRNMRLNFAVKWGGEVEKAIARLGELSAIGKPGIAGKTGVAGESEAQGQTLDRVGGSSMADILDRLLNDGRGCYSVKQIGRSISEPQPEFVQVTGQRSEVQQPDQQLGQASKNRPHLR